jgi:hypothetical protein
LGGVAALVALAEEEEGGADVAAGEGVLEDGEGQVLEHGQALVRRHGVELAAGLDELLEVGLGEEGFDVGCRDALGAGGLDRGEAVGQAEAEAVLVDSGWAWVAGAHDQGHSMRKDLGLHSS